MEVKPAFDFFIAVYFTLPELTIFCNKNVLGK
jgi:hypothetical protein